ncbi:MAG: phage protein Gp27 family protein [Pseudomonadota bacterium]
MAERKGRGRLSSIDLLPDVAEGAILWANEQLRARSLPANAILVEFNERLLDLNAEHDLDPPITPISRSAFNRHSVRKALIFRKLDEAQRIGAELVRSLDPKMPEEVTIAVAELIKASAFELLEEGDLNAKGLMELSRAVSTAVQAQAKSSEYRERLEREVQAKLTEAAKKVGELGEAKGVSPEAMRVIHTALGIAA